MGCWLDYEEIEKMFVKQELHPLDLKLALAREINSLLKVFRENKERLEKLGKAGYS